MSDLRILSSLSAAVLVSFAVVSGGGGGLGCGGSSDSTGSSGSSGSSGTSGSSGASGTSGSSGTSGTSGSSGGGAGGPGAAWFIGADLRKVGATDASGATTFEDDLADEIPKGVAVGGGAAWVITDKGNLLRYDTAKPARVTSIATGAKLPSFVVFAGGSVWVTDDNDGSGCTDLENGSAKLLRIDPATNTVAARISITATDTFPCNRFDGLATDGKAVYPLVDNAFGVVRVDTATYQVSKRAALGEGEGYGIGRLAASADTLWVLNTNAHFIFALDPVTLATRSKTPVPDKFLGSLMVASKDAVYLEGSTRTVLRVDAANPTKQEEKEAPEEPSAFAFRGTDLFMLTQPEVAAEVIGLDPATLSQKSRLELPILYTVDRFALVE